MDQAEREASPYRRLKQLKQLGKLAIAAVKRLRYKKLVRPILLPQAEGLDGAAHGELVGAVRQIVYQSPGTLIARLRRFG